MPDPQTNKQATDLQKLITFGKEQREITLTVDGTPYIFLMETPMANQMVTPLAVGDSIGLLSAYVVKINELEFTAPHQKTELKEILGRMQNGVVRTLIDLCGEMASKQTEITESFTKK